MEGLRAAPDHRSGLRPARPHRHFGTSSTEGTYLLPAVPFLFRVARLAGETLYDAYAIELAVLEESIQDEIMQEERRQNSLFAHDERLRHTGLFLLAAVLINVLFLTFPPATLYRIISSFALYMVNPLHPDDPDGAREDMAVPDTRTIREFAGVLRNPGVTPSMLTERKKTFGKVLWDVFFINGQPLAIGFGLIFGMDILFALYSGYVAGRLIPGPQP